MATDSRKPRASVTRAAGAPHSAPPSAPFFSEPPVPLPNLDTLRATDILVRAFYTSLAPSSPPPLPAVALDAKLERTSAPLTVAPSWVLIDKAERETVGEVYCGALAREVVEAAADLFAARSLDRLVGAYAACAAWDDMRDVVATSFLPKDLGEVPHVRQEAVTAGTTAPTPLFLRSALSLAGVATRAPSQAMTLQSAISPPPLPGPTRAVACAAMAVACPIPPSSVPMDAYCRYVLGVEEAPQPASVLGAATPAHRAALARVRGAKQSVRPGDKSAADAAAQLLVTPSPPLAPAKVAKRGKRPGEKRHAGGALNGALGSSTGRGAGAGAPETLYDPLTTAMRQAPSSMLSDGAPNVSHPERLLPRVGGEPATPLLAADVEKKHAVKSMPRAGCVVLAVEQDRIWTTERPRVAPPRSDRRKEGVVCRVSPPALPEDAAAATEPKSDAARTATAAEPPGRDGADDGARTKRGAGRQPPSSAAAQAKREQARAKEAWTASFYTTADAAEEIPLQDQVQVFPSAGVTVMTGTPSPGASSLPQRSNKGAGANNVLASGGDFVVPADRLALSSYDEKRGGARKVNAASGRAPQTHRDNARGARPPKVSPSSV